MFSIKSALRPIIFYTVGDSFMNTQNPHNIKTLDLRVQNCFDLRDGNRDFCPKTLENTKEFLSSDFKMAANYFNIHKIVKLYNQPVADTRKRKKLNGEKPQKIMLVQTPAITQLLEEQ